MKFDLTDDTDDTENKEDVAPGKGCSLQDLNPTAIIFLFKQLEYIYDCVWVTVM